jgi:WD40 repeat protein
LDWIVMKALEKDRTRRYETANGYANDIRRYLADQPVMARPPSVAYRLQKFARRNRLLLLTLLILASTLVVGIVATSWQAIRATLAENRLAEVHRRVIAERDRAVRAERDAKKDRDRALESEQVVAAQAEELRRKLYVFHVSRAADAYEHDNFAKMREHLDECPEELRQWEWHRLDWLAHRQRLLTLRGGELPLFTSDGQHILSADFRETGAYGEGDKTNAVVVWNAKSGERAAQLTGHQAPVSSLALSVDNQYLATCDMRGEMILWDLSSGPEQAHVVHRWKAHDDKSDGLAFSPDGAKVASVGWDGWLKVWDASRSNVGALLFSHRTGFAMRGVSFNADGSLLATSGDSYGGETIVWDANSGEEVRRLRSDEGVSGAVAFSPQGDLLAAGNGNNIDIWDTLNWQRVRALQGHSEAPRGVAFRSQGDRLASCSYDTSVILWDAASGENLATLGRHPDSSHWLSFGPDGERVASFSMAGIRVWDAVVRPDVLTLRGHEVHPHALAISTDQRLLVSAGCDGTVKLWDAASGIEVRTLHSDGESLWAVAIDRNGELIAAAGDEGTIFVWQAITGQVVHRLRGHAERVTSLSFRPSGSQLASASADDTIRIWDLRTGKTTRTLDDHHGDVNCVVFSADGERLASAGEDQKLYVWKNGLREPEITISDHSDDLETVGFAPDGSRLATGTRDGTIAVYDTKTGKQLFSTRGDAARATSMAFSPDAKRLFSAGSDRAIRVWSTSHGEQLLNLRDHDRPISALVVMPDGTAIASASLDGTIKVWEAKPRRDGSFLDRDRVEQARRIVDELYEEHEFAAEVMESLRADVSLDSSTRSIAQQIVNARGELAWTLNNRCLAVVRRSDYDMETYQLAVRRAEAACRASPESWRFLPTLGMALYRAGEYDRALKTLRNAQTISEHTFGVADPSILAFAAMTLHRLGRSDESREALERGYTNKQGGRWSRQLDVEAFLAEAQKVMGHSPQPER